MTKDNAKINAKREMNLAREVLAEARHLLDGGFFNGAVTRAYYAAFHGARSLLLTRGLESKTHRGVIQLFTLYFVKDGPLPIQMAEHLSHLAIHRELSDYTAVARFSKEQANEEIVRADAFINACSSLKQAGAPPEA